MRPEAPKSAAVPDMIIRPSDRPPSLPALIRPKTNRVWVKVAIGAAVAFVLLIAGLVVFGDDLAAQLPGSLRSLLQLAAI